MDADVHAAITLMLMQVTKAEADSPHTHADADLLRMLIPTVVSVSRSAEPSRGAELSGMPYSKKPSMKELSTHVTVQARS